ncbi:MAG: family oxidoreductase [Devosia sp.]|nr:family oxidoreductase [Devosia sp.]
MKPDVIIIGSGIGGSTMAAALAPSGRRIMIIERGDRLLDSPEARDAGAIFGRGHFRPKETWLDGTGRGFNPGNYYLAGGNSKFFGAVLIRYRREDFAKMRHLGGTTPGWPISYEDMEADYQAAETLYRVRGTATEDPTEPPHSGGYPFPPLPDEPAIADVRRRLKSVGLHPSSLPLGVDLDRWLARAKTPWDAFPDTVGAKSDAESVGLAAALRHDNVTLVTGTRATRLIADEYGKITGVEVERNDGREVLSAPIVVLSAGAVQSAALLLASADKDRPNGLANSSDQVGRNFMNHNISAVLAFSPFRRNDSVYEKTIQFNDWYLKGGPGDKPLGNVQMLGKVTGPILAAETGWPLWLSRYIAEYSMHLMTMSEDLPNPDSRVMVRDGRIVLHWQRSNFGAHVYLTKKLKSALRRAGWPRR